MTIVTVVNASDHGGVGGAVAPTSVHDIEFLTPLVRVHLAAEVAAPGRRPVAAAQLGRVEVHPLGTRQPATVTHTFTVIKYASI